MKRSDILDRDGRACVCCGNRTFLTLHHRKNRGMGGSARVDQPSDLLTCCSSCNQRMESDPAFATKARENGWKVSRYADPATVPVLRLDGNWWLPGPTWTPAPELGESA